MSSAAAGTSTIMPSAGLAASIPVACKLPQHLLEQPSEGRELTRVADHRRHDLEPAEGRRAGERAQLDAEDVGAGEREAKTAQSEEGVALALGREPGDRLVAAGIERADHDRPAARPAEDVTIGAILSLLVGQLLAPEQELGPGQTDAVAMGGIERLASSAGSSTLT